CFQSRIRCDTEQVRQRHHHRSRSGTAAVFREPGPIERVVMLVLGIETSCDETAAAVVRDGREILSNVIYSQVKTHTTYGGVVPEIASREHLLKIRPIVDKAFADAGVRSEEHTSELQSLRHLVC